MANKSAHIEIGGSGYGIGLRASDKALLVEFTQHKKSTDARWLDMDDARRLRDALTEILATQETTP